MIRQTQIAEIICDLTSGEETALGAAKRLFKTLLASLSGNQKAVLNTLLRHPDGVTAKQMGEALGMSQQYACNLLTDLEILGLAYRERGLGDPCAIWYTKVGGSQ